MILATPKVLLRFNHVAIATVVLCLASQAYAETRDHASRLWTGSDIDRVIAAMSPSEKIGQLLLVSCDQAAVDSDLREMLEEWRVGGVILYRRNLGTPAETRALTNAIRETAQGPVTPLVATDEEGGVVRRTTTPFPGNMALGATGSAALAFEAGLEVAGSLRELGITMNLAPVLDVYRNPASAIGSRAFSDRAELVGIMGAAFIDGQTAGRMISVAKHFVGEGSAAGDTHTSTPVLTAGVAEIRANDLVPFRAAIARGVPAIMTSHIAAPELTSDGDVPITLSSAAVTELLRNGLEYDGVIITDAFEMTGIRNRHPLGELAVRAFEAGADMILTVGKAAQRRAIFQALQHAYSSGRIDDARLTASLRRILKLKSDFDVAEEIRGARASHGVANRIAERSITLVKQCPDSAGAIADAIATGHVVVVGPQDSLLNGLSLRQIALERRPSARDILFAITTASACVTEGDVVIAAAENEAQAGVIRQIAAVLPDVLLVVISLGNPHDLELISGGVAYVATYGSTELTQQALIQVLRDQQPALGALPVSLRQDALDLACQRPAITRVSRAILRSQQAPQ